MYNKLFTKILDSSIWLAPDPHRIVWITLIAAMDEDGNAMFASAGNLAARARVTREQAESAVAAFEAPDSDSADPEHEGRRIERFPGGWHVLNAAKYRALVTKAIIREQTRVRTANYRAAQRSGDAVVTQPSRTCDAAVTPSVALSVSGSTAGAKEEKTARKRASAVDPTPLPPWIDAQAWNGYEAMRQSLRKPMIPAARLLAIAKLSGLRDTGQDTTAVLLQSTFRSWVGLFAVRPDDPPPNGAMIRHGTAEPAWRTEQRERTAAFAGRFAAKPPGHKAEESEVVDVSASFLG